MIATRKPAVQQGKSLVCTAGFMYNKNMIYDCSTPFASKPQTPGRRSILFRSLAELGVKSDNMGGDLNCMVKLFMTFYNGDSPSAFRPPFLRCFSIVYHIFRRLARRKKRRSFPSGTSQNFLPVTVESCASRSGAKPPKNLLKFRKKLDDSLETAGMGLAIFVELCYTIHITCRILEDTVLNQNKIQLTKWRS